MTCESCESGQPIYESGCPGCEARALALMEEKPQNNQEEADD